MFNEHSFAAVAPATRFPNRVAAGRLLARRLAGYRGRNDVLVLALPRGGVPVAFEVARQLGLPLDVLVVRKLGVPGFPELAMGAIAAGGVRVVNEGVVRETRVTPEQVEQVASDEQRELGRRERLYRGDAPPSDLTRRTVILVDDGLATGATMRAAIIVARHLGAARVIVAVPVAPVETSERFAREADEVVCLMTPDPFWAIGQWYVDFSQVSDQEVRDLLAAAAAPTAEAVAAAGEHRGRTRHTQQR
jgi:predicted phosphoribosyltransferase